MIRVSLQEFIERAELLIALESRAVAALVFENCVAFIYNALQFAIFITLINIECVISENCHTGNAVSDHCTRYQFSALVSIVTLGCIHSQL